MKIKTKQFIKGSTNTENILHDKKMQVAFVGRSNVGKSSLINSLLGGKGLARTGKKPGKTTEINFYQVNEKYYFADLPGYGFAQGGIEQQENIRGMIIEYLTHKGFKPHTVALVLDAKAGLTDFDRDMLDILEDNKHYTIIVLNKVDKLTQKEVAPKLSEIRREYSGVEIVPYSTVDEKGRKALLQMLVEK